MFYIQVKRLKNCVPSKGKSNNQSEQKSQHGTSQNSMAAGSRDVNINQSNLPSGIVVTLSTKESQGNMEVQGQLGVQGHRNKESADQSSQNKHEECSGTSEKTTCGSIVQTQNSVLMPYVSKTSFTEMYNQVLNDGQITCFKRPRLGMPLHLIEV